MDCCEVPRLQHDDDDDGIGRRKNHVIVTGEFYVMCEFVVCTRQTHKRLE
jgi:hypothetical protein